MKSDLKDTKKLFRKLGSCSRTFFYILNREYGHMKELEENAADPLAGGIYQQGYQCGMLWGSILAAGAESYRRYQDQDKAIGIAMKASMTILDSFVERTDNIECSEIADCDWSSKLSMAKYFFSGKFLYCFDLAEEWAPEAIEAAEEGLSAEYGDLPEKPLSCASEVIKKRGGSEEEMIMVAGFAGGLGLSGNACGALAAAIWMIALESCRKKEKISYKDPKSEERMGKFYEASDYKIMCSEICGKHINNIAEHTEYIAAGGCEKIISSLAKL